MKKPLSVMMSLAMMLSLASPVALAEGTSTNAPPSDTTLSVDADKTVTIPDNVLSDEKKPVGDKETTPEVKPPTKEEIVDKDSFVDPEALYSGCLCTTQF